MTNLHVLLDGGHLGRHGGGDETYVAGLLQGFADIDIPHTVDVLSPRPEAAAPMIPRHARIRLVRAGPRSTALRNSVTLPLQAARGTDVLHAMLYAPPWSRPPLVLYVPDASYLTHPQFYPRSVRIRLVASIGYGMRYARRIVTLSDESRRNLLAHYRIAADRIHVSYPGVDTNRFSPKGAAAAEEVKRRLQLPDRYVLYVGNLHPRKNLTALLDEFALLCGQSADVPPLVIVGLPWWQASPIYARVRQLGLTERVRFTGWIEHTDLPFVVAGSQAFVYPSLVEGFGLPPIEAMACGVPVVALATSVFPEILGDAAMLVPAQAGGIARGLREVLTSEPLRQHLRHAGFARAARYTWAHCAQATLHAYGDAVQTGRKAS